VKPSPSYTVLAGT